MYHECCVVDKIEYRMADPKAVDCHIYIYNSVATFISSHETITESSTGLRVCIMNILITNLSVLSSAIEYRMADPKAVGCHIYITLHDIYSQYHGSAGQTWNIHDVLYRNNYYGIGSFSFLVSMSRP